MKTKTKCECCEGTNGRGHKIVVVGGSLCVTCKHPAFGHKPAVDK